MELKEPTALQILLGEPNDEVVTYTKTSALQVSGLRQGLRGQTFLVTRLGSCASLGRWHQQQRLLKAYPQLALLDVLF